MAVVVKVALARVEGACELSETCSCWAVDNLSTEDLWISMVTGRVANAVGVLVPGGRSFFAGELRPEPLRKIYYSSRQPNVKLRIRTDADARNPPP